MDPKFSSLSSLFLFFLGFVSFLFLPRGLQAQCTVSANADPLNISCGDTVDLSAVGNTGNVAFGDDFNDGSLDAGWSSNTSVDFSNPCDASPDGTDYAWMGPTVDQPRILTTNSYDVSCGGEVCFDFDMASQANSEPCEGPDQVGEGVSLQYSTDGGATWNEFYYFNPDTACCGCTGGCNGYAPSPFVDWDNYCFEIPPAAETGNTQFRFFQAATSGEDFDHWGIDDFQVFANDCSYWYDWQELPGNENAEDTSVTVGSDTTFNLVLTNGTDSCTSSVSVNVLFPSVTTTASPTTVCPGGNTTLDAQLTDLPADTCCYTLEMKDSGGDGWNGADITVYDDGTALGTYSASGSGSIEQFCISDGNTLELEYTAGTNESENTYILYDPGGNSIFSDGPTPSTGTAFTTTAACGSVPYNISWSPSAGVSDPNDSNTMATVNDTTTYTATVEQPVNSCLAQDSVTVETVQLEADIVPPDSLTCANPPITLDASPSSSSSGSIDYAWSTSNGNFTSGTGSVTADVDETGDYTLTVTDPVNGCTADTSFTVVADSVEPSAVVARPDTLTCDVNNVTLDGSASTSNSGNLDYSWSTGDNTATTTVNSPGSYKLTVTDPDNGCTDDTSVTVPIDTTSPSPKVVEPDTLTCTKTSVTLDGSSSTTRSGNKTYTWSNGDTGPTTTVNTPGNYTLTVEDPDNGCAADTTISVPIDTASPTPNVVEPDTLTCVTNSVVLDGSPSSSKSGSSSFAWSNGDSGPTTSVSTPGTYTLTVTDDNNGCTADTTVTVALDTVSPDPQVPTPDTLTCNDPTETLDASASTTRSGYALFLWSTGDSSATTTVSSPGSYTVTVADPNNGCFSDTTVDVYEADKPSIAIDSTPLTSCKGSCDGSVHISVNGGEAPYSYQWNDPSGQTSQDATSLCAGTYGVEVTDANGCVVTDTATVNEPSRVQVDVSSDTTICIGGTAVLKATGSGGTPGYTYHWDQGLGTGQVQTVSPSSATNYTVYAEDANGCVSENKTVRVELHPELQVTASPDDSICPGDVERLTAQGSGGSGNGYSYSWSHGDFGDTTLVGPSSKTDYVVTLEDGCETPAATDTVTVKLNKLPDVDFQGSDLNGCKPVDASFTNLTTDSLTGSDCVWDMGNGEKAASCDSIGQLYEEPGCYDVSLTVVSPEGCVDSTTKSNYVCVRPYPEADFEQEPERADVLNPRIHFRNLSTGAAIYEWNFGGLDSSNAVHPTYEFPPDGPGDYDVCLKAETNYGCRDSICRTVTIDDKALIYVPNAFNPDGDGENEYFKPVVQGIDPNEYHFYVYDRWGQVVFETHHPEGKWDGSVDGSTSSSKTDVFVWRVVTENKYTGEKIEKSGHVTLIR